MSSITVSELEETLDRWALKRGIMPIAALPDDEKRNAAHNKAVADDAAREAQARATLVAATNALHTAICTAIAPAALPADMPVQDMVSYAKARGIPIPPALIDADCETRPVDAAGVVAPTSPAPVVRGANTRPGKQLGRGVYLASHDGHVDEYGRRVPATVYHLDIYPDGNDAPGSYNGKVTKGLAGKQRGRLPVALECIGDKTIAISLSVWEEQPE